MLASDLSMQEQSVGGWRRCWFLVGINMQDLNAHSYLYGCFSTIPTSSDKLAGVKWPSKFKHVERSFMPFDLSAKHSTFQWRSFTSSDTSTDIVCEEEDLGLCHTPSSTWPLYLQGWNVALWSRCGDEDWGKGEDPELRGRGHSWLAEGPRFNLQLVLRWKVMWKTVA